MPCLSPYKSSLLIFLFCFDLGKDIFFLAFCLKMCRFMLHSRLLVPLLGNYNFFFLHRLKMCHFLLHFLLFLAILGNGNFFFFHCPKSRIFLGDNKQFSRHCLIIILISLFLMKLNTVLGIQTKFSAIA